MPWGHQLLALQAWPSLQHAGIEALRMQSWNTQPWVTQALNTKTSFRNTIGGPSEIGTGSSATAIDLRLPPQDEPSWTALISQHAKCGQSKRALRIYKEMREGGVKPSSYTFVAALKACSNLKDLESGRQIHAEVVGSGLESDVYVGTMLIDVYIKCASLVDARHVFEKIDHRNVVSWTAMILGYAQKEQSDEALRLYVRMQQEGVVPNDRTFVGALKAYSSLAAAEDWHEVDGILVKKQCLDQVRAIHSDIIESGFLSDVFVGTMLLDVYAKCGSLMDARDVFEKMRRRNVVSWNALIFGYAQMKEGHEALQLYSRMQHEGVVPDARTFVSALKACSCLAAGEEGNNEYLRKQCLAEVRAIHTGVLQGKLGSHVFVGTMLVDAYGKCGSLVDARAVFDEMPHHDVACWTAIIVGYAQVEAGEEALQLYARMQQEGVVPNDRTFVGALKACSSLAASEDGTEVNGVLMKYDSLEQVRSIHAAVMKSDFHSHMFVGTMLVDVYVKCGSLVDARSVFETMPRRDVVAWSAMIMGYAQMERGDLALQLYAQMQQEGLVPNDRTFVGALKACGSVAGLDKGKQIHSQILECGLVANDLFVASSLIDMYSKCGSMVDAQQVLEGLPRRDLVTWSALIAGYARQGESYVVFDLLERMKQEGIQPEAITFLSVLTVCNHAGLVDRGQKYFEAMSKDFGITPTIEHYTCMIDLLGRAGQVEQAIEMAKTMPYQPDAVVWQTILVACRKWRNVEVGRQAFERAVELDRNDAAAYISLANIYAAAEMWDEANEFQATRVKHQAWKQPGQSWWTDSGGTVHTFLVEDQEHPDSRRIYAELRDFFIKIDEEGYVIHHDFITWGHT